MMPYPTNLQLLLKPFYLDFQVMDGVNVPFEFLLLSRHNFLIYRSATHRLTSSRITSITPIYTSSVVPFF